MGNYHILITNDDGIASPGLRAAAEAVSALGTITVVAPSHQQTGAGRGLSGDRQASLIRVDYDVNGSNLGAYHCDGSPALIVRHGLRTLFSGTMPDLVVSGINYGENLGTDVTTSGTIGAALEAACLGIPGIAISKQTDVASHNRYTDQDWSAACYFLNQFAGRLLEKPLPADVNVLKIDVPGDATPASPWKMTKLAKAAYYARVFDKPAAGARIGDGRTIVSFDKENLDPDSDIHALAIDKAVSITPLSVDLTSRVELSDLQAFFSR